MKTTLALILLMLLSTACAKHDSETKQADQSASMTLPGKTTPVLCNACGSNFYGVVCPHVECQ